MKKPDFYHLMIEKNQRILTKDDFDTTIFIHANDDGKVVFWSMERLYEAVRIFNDSHTKINIKPDALVALGYHGIPSHKKFANFCLKLRNDEN
jgi:hypothetical protein